MKSVDVANTIRGGGGGEIPTQWWRRHVVEAWLPFDQVNFDGIIQDICWNIPT